MDGCFWGLVGLVESLVGRWSAGSSSIMIGICAGGGPSKSVSSSNRGGDKDGSKEGGGEKCRSGSRVRLRSLVRLRCRNEPSLSERRVSRSSRVALGKDSRSWSQSILIPDAWALATARLNSLSASTFSLYVPRLKGSGDGLSSVSAT